jgi:hypothetical protein
VKVKIIKLDDWQSDPYWGLEVGGVYDCVEIVYSTNHIPLAKIVGSSGKSLFTTLDNIVDVEIMDTPLYKAMNEEKNE